MMLNVLLSVSFERVYLPFGFGLDVQSVSGRRHYRLLMLTTYYIDLFP
jgi:hypothetical protein